MKTLILYATKYGAAEEIANRIAGKMNGASVVNLKTDKTPPLADFDCVIIGSSVYVGAVHKEVKDYVAANAAELSKKKLGLFLSGLQESGVEECFQKNFPESILKAAVSAKALGARLDPKKAGFIDRIIIKAIIRQSDVVNKIDDGKIEAFAQEMLK